METAYNRIAGQSVERLAALSDGVFAVAMTLLVLDLRAPAAEAVHIEHDLWRALVALSPRLLMFMMTFLTLGIFWVGQQIQLNHLLRSDRSLSWIHILFLFRDCPVALCVRSAAVRGQYILEYWIYCSGAAQLCDCATHSAPRAGKVSGGSNFRSLTSFGMTS
jgi:Endosomal/lysosomal potassium channel TMEM175